MGSILIVFVMFLSACGGSSYGPPRRPTSPIDIASARPIVISGKGNQTVRVNKWDGFAVMRVTAKGAGQLKVYDIDDRNNSYSSRLVTVVSKTGDYVGNVLLDVYDTNRTTARDIESSGTWEFVILPPKDTNHIFVCRDCNSDYQGRGDDVMLITPQDGYAPDLFKIDAPNTTGTFFVTAYGSRAEISHLVQKKVDPIQA